MPEDEEEFDDDMDDFDKPINNDVDNFVDPNYGVPQSGRVGIFPSNCRTYTSEDGQEFLMVPLDLYRWIICIPYTGKYKEVMSETGMIRIPISNVDTPNDWSLNTEVFLEGKPMAPFRKLRIVLDRDAKTRLPRVKLFDMDG